MNEITLVNLLNEICDKRPLTWQLTCKYGTRQDHTYMQIIFDDLDHATVGEVLFEMESGLVVEGNYTTVLIFKSSTSVTDALLEILYFETTQGIVLRSMN